MELKPFKELIKLSKEKLDESLAPMRARAVKAKAELEMAKLDERRVQLEMQVQEICAQRDVDFTQLLAKMDEHDLNERRLAQYKQLLAQLFPPEQS